ncbi:phosphatase 2C-like domain-containing protein [Aspergillus heterothallicus]
MNGTATTENVALSAVGSASARGSRPSQQDRHLVLTPDKLPSGVGKDIALFAVFDGQYAPPSLTHSNPNSLQLTQRSGSEIVAEHALQHIPNSLFDSPGFREGDYERAMQSAIDQEDKALFKGFHDGEMRFSTAGSTVTLALVDFVKRTLLVGNLGDSHAMLAERDPGSAEITNVTRLTEDHKPDKPDEKERIEDAGGTVHAQKSVARIGALNMSRSLGDLEYKQPLNNMDSGPVTDEQKLAILGTDKSAEQRGSFLSIELSFKKTELANDKQYLLALTSDGVTNCMEDKVIMHSLSHLLKSGQSVEEAARSMVDETTSNTGSDNATCIVVLISGAQVQEKGDGESSANGPQGGDAEGEVGLGRC